jgi:hypothetical protein
MAAARLKISKIMLCYMLRTLICFISSLGLAAAWPAIVKAKSATGGYPD